MTRDRLRAAAERVAVPLWAAALTAFLVAPLRRSGYPLGHDLVFTPRQPLDAATLGVSSAPPRAVPADALVALAERLVDGALVGRLALVLPLLLAGTGAARLLAGSPLAARLVACGFAIWNPYVVERLAIGQWSLLWGYAALPWILVALREQRRSTVPSRRLVLALAAGSVTATGGLLAVLVTVAATFGGRPRADGRHPRRAAAGTVALAVVLQLPWLVAGALSSASSTGDPAAVAAFASRGEFGGVVPSLLGLGGIWDAGSVPPSRETAYALVTVAVLAVAAVVGARTLGRRLGALARPLVACAAVGFVLAVAGSVTGPDAVLRWVVGEVPGGGLLRDAQKWLAPVVLLAAVLLGAAVERLTRAARAWSGIVLAAALALPLALLPDASTAVWPTLTPVHYPAGYAAVDRLARGHGDVAVLPFQPYRRYAWAGGRISFGPVPRLLSTGTVSGDRLQVGTSLLAGEDPRAAQVADALSTGGPSALARAGIGWVLVERRTPGDVPSLDGLRLVRTDADVALYRVPGAVRAVEPSRWKVVLGAGAHVVWVGLWLTALVSALVATLRSGLRSTRRRLRARTEPAQDLQGQAD